MLLAWAIYLGAAVNLAWLALFLWYTTQFQIMREERALVEIFGQAYRDYCARVRRWL
jgi:protein-S-isoprenylcysteine O-methyltransferase Ste14